MDDATRYDLVVNDDLFPAYVALIRHELKLAPGSDAIAELAARITPESVVGKPPARAPGIVRLKQALHCLQEHGVPDTTLGEFAADLRFLQLFSLDEPVLGADAMERLLADVSGSNKRRTPISRLATHKKADA